MRRNPFQSGGPLPFEDVIRNRYTIFRSRERHGLATLVDLVWLIILLSLVIFVLLVFLTGLIVVLFAAPFVILALSLARWISPSKRRTPHGTIIDVEVERR
jgi:Flp pilus assembly protein TadB